MKEQIGGSHYESMAMQPIDFINANHMQFAEGCAIKYVSRHQSKNGAEDLKKAMQNIAYILKRDYAVGCSVTFSKRLGNDIINDDNFEETL